MWSQGSEVVRGTPVPTMSQDLEVLYDEPEKRPHGTLSFTKTPEERSRTGEHIQSWSNMSPAEEAFTDPLSAIANGNGNGNANANTNTVVNGDTMPHSQLKFEVVSARTVEETGQKKYVAYTLRIRKDGTAPDPHPAVIERRYSDFLELYNSLKREFPALMSRVSFPKKVLMGNFGPGVISARRNGFESFLNFTAKEERMHQSPSIASFLQKPEQLEAQSWMLQKRYDLAVPLLENAFRLLNKLYTDRHPFVIIALCRLVACCTADTSGEARAGGRAERFAELALRRFEAVSDADLLRFYIPLLQLCVHLWWANGKDKQPITNRLEDMKRRGIRVDGLPSLLDSMLLLDA